MYTKNREYACGIEFKLLGSKVYLMLFTKKGSNRLLEGMGVEVEHTRTDLFRSPEVARSNIEEHYFVIARKPESPGPDAGRDHVGRGG